MSQTPWLAHYDAGVPAELDFEEVSLSGFLDRTVQRFPERVAIAFMNRTLTYSELARDVDRLATGFRHLGVEPGTRVAIMLPNLPQTVIAYYAALAAGAEVVLTNPLYTQREVEHQWRDADVHLVVTADFLWAHTVEPIRRRLPVKHYILTSIPDYLRFPLSFLARWKLKRESPPKVAPFTEGDGVIGMRSLMARASGPPPKFHRSLDAIAVLQYTGGTTGPSKGAMLTHRNLSANVQQISAWFVGLQPGEEVLLVALPLFHVFGMTVGMNWAVECGATMALVANPRDAKGLAKTIEKRGVTIFPAVPAMFNALNQLEGIEGMDLRSVKYCFSGSAPIADEVLTRFEALTGARILEGFGMSESSPVTHVNPLQGERKVGSIGMPVSSTLAKIVDVDDPTRQLDIGEEGELLMRGPQVMEGYWKQPAESARALVDGWLLTGDLATMDADGYFRIVGRKKDMINCNGMKVYPDEVDNVLMAHPDILEAATIGVPDPRFTETVKSFVVLRPGTSLDAEGVRAYCAKNLAKYKCPRQVEFLDELPKSSVMKILRRELRDREIALLESPA
ncbi:MAG: long-chain fatty acid--CoA ligase [Planctomycetota bacterium]